MRLTRNEGKGVWRWGEREIIYLSLHCHHQNDSCIKVCSDESHWFLMFRICEGQSHKTVSTDHNFWRERRAEADWNRGPSAYQPNALPCARPNRLTIGIVFPRDILYSHWPMEEPTDSASCTTQSVKESTGKPDYYATENEKKSLNSQ